MAPRATVKFIQDITRKDVDVDGGAQRISRLCWIVFLKMKRVPRDYFAPSPFPLPPLAEQQRIVAKVDELMALCDELEEAQTKREYRRDRLVAASQQPAPQAATEPPQEATPSESQPNPDPKTAPAFYLRHLAKLTTKPNHIKQLRQTILNLAVQGKLVAQDPNDEPTQALFSRLRRNNRRTEEVVARSQVPFCIPSTWRWVPTSEIAIKVSDGVHKKPDYVPSGVPFLTVRNLTAGPGISFSQTKFIRERDHQEFTKRTHPEQGDVLITKDGTIGVARVIDTDKPFSNFVSLALVKLVLPELSRFYALCINSEAIRSQIVPKGAALKHLHLVDLRKLPVPVPPLAEQHRIVARVNALMALCDELETTITQATTTRTALLGSILQEALHAGESR